MKRRDMLKRDAERNAIFYAALKKINKSGDCQPVAIDCGKEILVITWGRKTWVQTWLPKVRLRNINRIIKNVADC